MLGKWLKGKSVPSNEGNNAESLEKLQYVKVFELELSNMEDGPVYPLSHQLSIGSEIGNIIIADPSISPRHATFVLQDEVVSIMDHGSVAGTFINGKKIDSGKSIILEETDVVMVGDLEIRLKVGRKGIKQDEIPDLPSEDAVPEKKEAALAELSEEEPVAPEKTPKSYIDFPKKTETPKQQKVIALKTTAHSTNALMRVIAVVCDLILAYVILTVFLPFDEFRLFLDAIPEMIAGVVDLDAILAMTGHDLSYVKNMLSDAFEFFNSTFHLLHLLIVFAMVRLTSTLLLGVSISEMFLGIRPVGNPLWSRIGGMLRVLVGFITWPFLIFDVPSLVSKRTFKEVITFTNTQVPSKFIAILGVLFYLPLLVALGVISPLAQGLEFPEAVLINDKVDQRIKVKVNDAAAAEAVSVTDKSQVLNMEISYPPEELNIIPDFKFHGIKSKLNVRNSLIFYQRDLQTTVEFELYKTFSLKQLLGFGIKGNFFLYDKYPEIYNYVYEPEDLNIAFRKGQNPKAELKFANDVIQFTKSAFNLSLENVAEVMQTETPFIKSLVDYRSSLLGLVEYKEFDQINFVKIGNIVFMKISYNMQKPFDLLIPLVKGPGRIFKVNFSKKEEALKVSSKFYKFNLEKTNWLPEGKIEAGEALSALQVFDLFSGENYKSLLQSSAQSQALYGYYYETSASVMKKGDPVEKEIWKAKVLNLLNLLEKLPDVQATPEEVSPKAKLLQNFRDTVDALEHNNSEYFGVTQNTSV